MYNRYCEDISAEYKAILIKCGSIKKNHFINLYFNARAREFHNLHSKHTIYLFIAIIFFCRIVYINNVGIQYSRLCLFFILNTTIDIK
jgi:hypothetical protein